MFLRSHPVTHHLKWYSDFLPLHSILSVFLATVNVKAKIKENHLVSLLYFGNSNLFSRAGTQSILLFCKDKGIKATTTTRISDPKTDCYFYICLINRQNINNLHWSLFQQTYTNSSNPSERLYKKMFYFYKYTYIWRAVHSS